MLGILFGMLIGQSTFRKKYARALIFLYSIALLLWQLIFALSDHSSWINRLSEYGHRVATATQQLVQNVPLDDGILFLTGSAIIFCVVSMLFGYRFIRYRKAWIPFTTIVIIYFNI